MARRRRRFRPGRRPRRGKRPSAFGEVVGVPFYQPEQWSRLKEIAADPDTIEDSHGAWLSRFRKCEADMKRIGVLVKQVYVDVEDLAQHCEERGVSCTREYRAQYAAELFRQAQLRAREEEEYED